MRRTIESMPPDIHLWDYGHQLSGHNVFQGYMSCNNQLASLDSGVDFKCWNGMSWGPLGQVTVLPGLQCQDQPPATVEYTVHVPCLELTLARQCQLEVPVAGAGILLLTSRCLEKRAREKKKDQRRS